MVEPPKHSLEASVVEGIMIYKANKEKSMKVNSALLGIYGALHASGTDSSVEINDLIREMSSGI